MMFLALCLFLTDPAPKPPAPEKVTIAGPQGPVTVRVGEKCVLAVVTNSKKVTWVTPKGCDSLAIDGKRLAVWATEGTYRFLAQVPSGDDVLSTEVILIVVGPRPPPDPVPPTPVPPTPVPPPQPVKTGEYIVMIVDETDTGTWQTAVTDGPTAKSYRAQNKLYVYGFTSDAAKIKTKNYDQLLRDANQPAPALIVLDSAGKPSFPAKAIPLPKNDADLKKVLDGVMKP